VSPVDIATSVLEVDEFQEIRQGIVEVRRHAQDVADTGDSGAAWKPIMFPPELGIFICEGRDARIQIGRVVSN
jgi:hypothetical protein